MFCLQTRNKGRGLLDLGLAWISLAAVSLRFLVAVCDLCGVHGLESQSSEPEERGQEWLVGTEPVQNL